MDEHADSDDEARVQAVAIQVAEILQRRFMHTAAESRALFDAFHSEYSRVGGWAPADYYDHETAGGIALEIEFRHQFPRLDPRGLEFLDWRKDKWA